MSPKFECASANSLEDPRIGRPLACGLNGIGMGVEPGEGAVEVRLGHVNRAGAVAVSHVGGLDAWVEPVLDPVESGYPSSLLSGHR